jgi:hypothetical protein
MEYDARLEAEQANIDKLEQELKEMVERGLDYALGEYHRMSDKLAKAKRFIKELEAENR